MTNVDDFPEIKTGNGYTADLSATTNDRLKKTVSELRSLNSTLNSFNTNSDKWSKKLVQLTWVVIIFTIILVVLTVFIIRDDHKQAQLQNNIALNSMFFGPINTGIIETIENKQHILLENNGKYNDAQLDNYLGSFDTIESSLDDNLLSESDFCDSFSYFINITNNNSEIKNYVSTQQKQDSEFFTSLKVLADKVKNSRNANCK